MPTLEKNGDFIILFYNHYTQGGKKYAIRTSLNGKNSNSNFRYHLENRSVIDIYAMKSDFSVAFIAVRSLVALHERRGLDVFIITPEHNFFC